MSRLFNDLAADYADYAGAVLTAVPMTMACWAYIDAAVESVLISLGNTANTDMVSLRTQADYKVSAGVRDAGAGVSAFAITTVAGAVNTWMHTAGVFTSATSRTAYINGGSAVSDTTNATPASLGITGVGSLSRNGGHSEYASGRIAEVAIWSVALNVNEIAALARGLLPWQVRPDSLAAYWPFWGLHSPEVDLSAGKRHVTLTGTVAAAHAPVVPFSSRYWNAEVPPQVVAAGRVLNVNPLDGLGNYYRRAG